MRVSPIASSYFSVQKNNVNENKNVSKTGMSVDNNYNSGKEISFGWWFKKKTVDPVVDEIVKKQKIFNKYIYDIVDTQLKVENITSVNGKIKGFIEYFTSSQRGRIPQLKVENNPDGTIKTITRFEYEPDTNFNRLLKTRNEDAHSNLQWETRYKYDERGKLVQTENYDANGKFLHRTEYSDYGFLGTCDRNVYKTTRDYDANGNLLNVVEHSRDEDFNKFKRIKYSDKSPRDDGRYYIFDTDDNLIEIVKYEIRSDSYAPLEIKYYPNGNFKSESRVGMANGVSTGGLIKLKEHYESGALKYIAESNGMGAKEYYENGAIKSIFNGTETQNFHENGKLKSKIIENTYYTGTHTSISSIKRIFYSQDGKPTNVIISYPKDRWVMGSYKGSAKYDFYEDGKTIKELQFFNNEEAANSPQCVVKYNQSGDLVSINGNSDFGNYNSDYELLKNVNKFDNFELIISKVSEKYGDHYSY